MMTTKPMRSVVVVGGSLAGVTACKTLREAGFEGRLILVGEETSAPYDRPPLSKQILRGEWGFERAMLDFSPEDLEVEWLCGTHAAGLDPTGPDVELADGRRFRADGVVIACGAHPLWLSEARGLAGCHVLRTMGDAEGLRDDLERRPGHVVVVGGGFIGCEVAASCRMLGLDVTVVEPLPALMHRGLGSAAGAFVTEVFRAEGVRVVTGVGVESVFGSEAVEGVRMADGELLEAEVVVLGLGVAPNTGWLQDSGLVIGDGVVCDENLRAAERVVACGDVARWPSRRAGEAVRVEHWENAVTSARHAALALVGALEPGVAYDPVPWFWSDQFDMKIQMVGFASDRHEESVLVADPDRRRFLSVRSDGGIVTAAVGVGMSRVVPKLRPLIERGVDVTTVRRLAEDSA